MSVMRAAVLVDVGRIEMRDVPRADPAPHEVLVRVTAVGLCGTDMHIVSGEANYNRDEAGRARPLREHPQILGHEIAGVVEDTGSEVRDLRHGEPIVVDQGRTCMSELQCPPCEYCVSGDSHQCARYREHGITGLPGGFAEFITVPARNCISFAAALAAERAALAEPLGCIVHSVDAIQRAAARYGLSAPGRAGHARTILVCGGGPSGLLFVQYLRRVTEFDGTLLVSEPNPLKRSLAEQFGAEAIDPSVGRVVEEIAERTAGRRADILIEASGVGDVFRVMPGLIRKQATVLLYGHGHAGVDLSVLNQVQFLEPTLVSPAGASGGHDHDGRPLTYRRALELIESNTIDVAPLITHRYHSLERVPSAFTGQHREPTFVKGVVLP